MKEVVKKVPVWCKIHELELKFWGVKCLERLAGLVGTYLQCDEATQEKTMLNYARILVEVEIDQELPRSISFEDEKDKIHTCMISYDWIPVLCQNCKMIGHKKDDCRKLKPQLVKPPTKLIWKQKIMQPQKQWTHRSEKG